MSTAREVYDDLLAQRPFTLGPLMPQLREHEGYRGMPYEDSLGKPTIGVGCLLPITEDESMLLAACRANDARKRLRKALRVQGIVGLPDEVNLALLNMAFQLGVPRFLGFKRMLAAIMDRRWNDAADEALDSKWAKQTPVRAQHVAEVLRRQA